MLGFLLLTHAKPEQTLRLVDRLNRMFGFPPIVCHHDFSKCPLDLAQFPSNLSFVQPHVKTKWGEFSVVEATVRSLQQLYNTASPPDWFVLLSGADYPIKPAAQILADLSQSADDAHIEFDLIDPAALTNDWQQDCFQRYYGKWVSIPQPLINRLGLQRHMLPYAPTAIAQRFSPFSDSFKCFAGAHWFCANHRTADVLLQTYRDQPHLVSHYRQTKFPEESFFQTVILNAPSLKVSRNHWRYIDWEAGGAHPKVLRMEDLPRLQAATAHFARKFDPARDAQILDALDDIVLQETFGSANSRSLA